MGKNVQLSFLKKSSYELWQFYDQLRTIYSDLDNDFFTLLDKPNRILFKQSQFPKHNPQTAFSLGFALYHLSTNQEAQDKLAQEARTLMEPTNGKVCMQQSVCLNILRKWNFL